MSEKNFFDQNLEMWEKFVGNNTDLMVKSMEKVMDASTSFKKHVSEAVSQTVSMQLDATMNMLKTLEKQVADLSERVDGILNKEKEV